MVESVNSSAGSSFQDRLCLPEACAFVGVLVYGHAIKLIGVDLEQVTHRQCVCCHGQSLLEVCF